MWKYYLVLLICCGLSVNSQRSRKQKDPLYKQRFLVPQEPFADDEVDYRLPTNVVPESYFVRLQPFIYGSQDIIGYEEIIFDVLDPVTNITLLTIDTTLDETSFTLETVEDPPTPIEIGSQSYDPTTDKYVSYPSEQLEPGKYKMTLEFVSRIEDDLYGLYRSSYTEDGEPTVYLGTTQFQSTFARKAFPCFDEPALKATFQMEIGHNLTFGAISNMPLSSSRPISGLDNWVWDTFEPSVPMSSYLVAFVISDFVNKTRTGENGVEFNVWARQSAIDQADYALEVGPDILMFYEGYFGIPFPLPKQDMVALPDFDNGAMENWGLITYREIVMLFDPLHGSADNKQGVTLTIAHELGHMWFGDLVTMEWWNDIWLNEGFATYVEYLGMDSVEPDFLVEEQYVISELQPVLQVDSVLSTHPLRVPVSNPRSIGDLFDSITYSKGSAVIRMANAFLTEATFKTGLHNYLEELSYSAASQEDLFRYLDEQAVRDGVLPEGLTVPDIMEGWTLQAGYPLLTVTVNKDGTATIAQERFISEEFEGDAPNTTWHIPITFQTSIAPDFDQTFQSDWMYPDETQKTIQGVDASADWALFNIQQTGFYRVTYDSQNWQALSNQLLSDHEVINVKNRAQLIDDSLNLATAGKITYDVPFDLTSYIVNETKYVPWQAALSNFDYIESMFTRTSGYTSLKSYLLTFVVPLYDYVTFEDDLNDPHTRQLLRKLGVSWACDLKHSPCQESAVQEYEDWMNLTPDDYSTVSPNVKTATYCTGVAQGGQEEWDFAYDRYLDTPFVTERENLMYALGCTTDIPTLSNYLDIIFTEGGPIRVQDSRDAFRSVSGNDIGRDLAWDYLLNNYDDVASYYDGSYYEVTSLAYYASLEFNTQAELLEVIAFKQVLEPLVSSISLMDAAIENVQRNIDWMSKYYDYITNWLLENGYSS